MLYCSKCKKHTNEACPKKKKIMITNIKIKGVSKRWLLNVWLLNRLWIK